MNFDTQICYAIGYAELGMREESLQVLAKIEKEYPTHIKTLQLKYHFLVKEEKWEEAARISQEVCRIAPDEAEGYLNASYCQFRLGKVSEAKQTLLEGPVMLLSNPIYFYNLACCHVILLEEVEAVKKMRQCFEICPSYREVAKNDTLLSAIWHLL
ncbi:MAG TPA: hypothetical protein VFA52_01845 [Candidatus Paceibacterota bacterium]|nr:hypothetical protein [Candidatus Paceibacterota bacterium]